MSLLTALVVCIVGFILACLQKIVADDFKAWRPTLVARTLDVAVRNLPAAKRPRYLEEWNGYVDGMPGELAKVGAALGCLIASLRISRSRERFQKRCLDIMLASVVLAVLAPAIAAIAIAVRLDSSGPIFVRQFRVGRHGKLIGLIRFRTMDHLGRQTLLGRFLTRAYMDELPTLFNVLFGQLSLIGPRAPKTAEEKAQTNSASLDERPGLVGLWAFEESECEGSRYLSLGLQVKLLVATVGAVVRKRVPPGSYPLLTQSFSIGLLCLFLFSLLAGLLILFGNVTIF